MSNTLRYYHAAKKDIGLNAFPHRRNGEFKFTPGQEEILTEERFKKIRKNGNEIEYLKTRKQKINREKLVYQDPTGKLANEAERQSANWKPEMDEEELRMKQLKQEQKQFIDDMLKLGIVIPAKKEVPKNPAHKNKSTSFTWKIALSFFGIWFVGEIFMTYVQWNALRNDKGVEDMVVRSLSFGVILFLVHLVAHFNRNRKRLVYPIFIGFSLMMLMTMLFAPLIIGKIYPDAGVLSSTAQQWSITNSNSTLASEVIQSPIWVQVYRDNETIPAILCFIFFVAMQSFMSAKKKTEEQPIEAELKIETEEEKVAQIIEYRAEIIRESENYLRELKAKQQDELNDNTGGLQGILSKLEAMNAECVEIDKKIGEFKTANEELLSALEKELNEYSAIFSEMIKNDEVKYSLVAIEWQTRYDIINHYKIKVA